MGNLTGTERFMKAIRREEPDRIPHWDGVHRNVVNALLPDDQVDELTGRHGAFAVFMDMDAISNNDKGTAWRSETVDETKRIIRDQWGGLSQYTAEALPFPIASGIQSEKEASSHDH